MQCAKPPSKVQVQSRCRAGKRSRAEPKERRSGQANKDKQERQVVLEGRKAAPRRADSWRPKAATGQRGRRKKKKKEKGQKKDTKGYGVLCVWVDVKTAVLWDAIAHRVGQQRQMNIEGTVLAAGRRGGVCFCAPNLRSKLRSSSNEMAERSR